MLKLYILCGFPFSGKSTLSKEISIKTGAEIISFDEISNSLTKSNPRTTYYEILENCRDKIKKILSDNISVVYDSTNLGEQKRSELKNIAKENGAEVVIIYLPISKEEIFRRMEVNKETKTHHDISGYDFDAAFNKLDVPADAVIINTNEDKIDFLSNL